MAQARGARIYGEVVGAGSSSVADRNLIARRDVALANAMRSALSDAGAKPEEIGHIQAHGLGTRSATPKKPGPLPNVFGARTKQVPVAAAKSYFGNLGAGSGLVELIAGTLALSAQRLFPVLNYRTPDPECPVAAVHSADVPPGESFLSVNVTPQGQASCVMVRSCALTVRNSGGPHSSGHRDQWVAALFPESHFLWPPGLTSGSTNAPLKG